MEWVRGEIVGRGSFSTVNLAIPRRDCNNIPPLIAVKSSLFSQSSLLQNEKEILNQLRDCPQIVRCLGDDLTIENGQKFYNVLLEFASRGNLAQLLMNSGGSIPESDVRYYTRSILRGLHDIHDKGFVHCDIKLQNILVCASPDGSHQVKIADFGLAKKIGQKNSTEANGVFGLRGTPLYMSPELVSRNEQEAPSDVWALGCAVVEMITGKPAWRCRAEADVSCLLFRIGFGEELPEIPAELSDHGKDFLRRCLVRDPTKRWTTQMLLDHPFVADASVSFPESEKPSPSPRSAFDFPEWSSSHLSILNSVDSSSSLCFEREFNGADRIRWLAMGQQPNWSSSDSWVTVRQAE